MTSIHFSTNSQNGLSVTIDTTRLHIRSVTTDDYDRYAALFGDKKVMEKFANGNPRTREEVQEKINNLWVKRWNENDPYSGLAVFRKNTDSSSSDFLGHVTLGHTAHAGESELAYLFHEQCWGNRYGSEAVTAVVKEYAPATVKQGYATLEGEPLQKIVATARTDNVASWRILAAVGMTRQGTVDKHGAPRYLYSINLSEFHEEPHEKVVDS
jgi:RimJ/RimL family protein N-acetyltransferase